MIVNCAIDGVPFEAVRPQAKYCSARCRKRAQRGTLGIPAQPRPKTVTPAATSISPDATSPNQGEINSLVKATRTELEAANVLNTMMGQQALSIAAQMSGRETAGGMAALSKELSRVMAEAMRSAVALLPDAVDELAKRRDDKAKMAV